MVNTEKIAGVDSYVLYGVESTYATAVTADTHLGLIQSFTPTIDRQVNEARGLKGSTTGGQGVMKYTLGQFTSGFTVDFNTFDFSWLQFVIGARTGTGTSADPFIYTEGNTLSSLTFSSSIDNVTTDRDSQHLGCMINTTTIRADVGNPVTVTMDVLSGEFVKDSTVQSTVALPTNEIVNFTGVDIERPDTTSISHIIDSVEIIFTRNPEIIYGLGSDLAKQYLTTQN